MRVYLWCRNKDRRPEDHQDFIPLVGKQVFIWSGEHSAYWGSNRAGYYDKSAAGVYPFSEAYASTSHCGSEKRIAYELASTGMTRAELSAQCSWIAKNAASWAGDLLTLPEKINEEVSFDSVRGFCASIRQQLAIIEGWGKS